MNYLRTLALPARRHSLLFSLSLPLPSLLPMGCSSSLSRPSTVSVIPPQQFPHRQLPDRKEGYILVCGLAHSGKSTLLHTIYQTLKHRGDPSNITLPLPLPPPTRSYVLYGGHYEQRHIIFVDTPCILEYVRTLPPPPCHMHPLFLICMLSVCLSLSLYI